MQAHAKQFLFWVLQFSNNKNVLIIAKVFYLSFYFILLKIFITVLPKYKQLLSDYENFEHNQRLRHLIDILIKNIVFRITNPGQENLEEHPEKEDAEFFQAADPEYQEYLSKYSKKATKKETNKKGATSLADAELDD